MNNNPEWIDVTELMQNGVGMIISRLHKQFSNSEVLESYIKKVSQLENLFLFLLNLYTI